VHLDVTLKRGVWIDPAKFVQQIADAGYAARKDDVRITLTGLISKDGENLLLTAEDLKPGPPKFELIQAKGRNEKEASAWAEAFKVAGASIGKMVELDGYWTPANVKKNKDALPNLAVIRVKEVMPETKKEELGK
jgi:hypothetical protein